MTSLHGSVTDDDRRPRPLLIWPPTLCVGGSVITNIKEQLKNKNMHTKPNCGGKIVIS